MLHQICSSIFEFQDRRFYYTITNNYGPVTNNSGAFVVK